MANRVQCGSRVRTLLTGICRPLMGVCLFLPCVLKSAGAIGPEVVQSELVNGATLLVSEQHALPIVQVIAIFDAGSRRDPKGAFGVANLVADTLTEGTTTRSSNEIAAGIELIGGSLSASAGVDYATLSLRVLRKDLDQGLRLFADVLLNPTFPPDEIERARESILAGLRSAEDNPNDVAGKEFSRVLYGEHPYAHPVEGTAASVKSINRAAVLRFYDAHYRASKAGVVVVGDVRGADIKRRLDEVLQVWPRGAVVALSSGDDLRHQARRVLIDKPVTQASIVLGHRGVARSNPDYEALGVLNYVLGGGGFSSRMMEKIRNQAGLVYSVSSYFSGGQLPGSFRVIMQTKNESVAQAIDLAREEIRKIHQEGVTDQELADAKRYLTGSFPLSLDSNGEIASFLASTWFLGRGLNAAETYLTKIDAVTAQDVRRVAAEYLHPDAILEVVVADKDAVTKSGMAGKDSLSMRRIAH